MLTNVSVPTPAEGVLPKAELPQAQVWQEKFEFWNTKFPWLDAAPAPEELVSAMKYLGLGEDSIIDPRSRGRVFQDTLTVSPLLAAAAAFHGICPLTGTRLQNTHLLPSADHIIRVLPQTPDEFHTRLLFALLLETNDKLQHSHLSELQRCLSASALDSEVKGVIDKAIVEKSLLSPTIS